MTSDLAIFAGRLRDFISIVADEVSSADPEMESALRAHYDIEFSGMALVLFGVQHHYNAAYRKFCEARKVTPNTITHWSQIPAMPTAAFKELELTCLSPGERTTVFHSSGTTEQRPSRHFHCAESLAIYEASLWPWFREHVLVDSQTPNAKRQLAILTPPPEQAAHSSLVHMFETIRRKMATPATSTEGKLWNTGNDSATHPAFFGRTEQDGSWTLDFNPMMRTLRRAEVDRQPLLLLGTAFSFVHLLDHLLEKGQRFTLPTGSRVMETGGYKGRSRTLPKAELHALITERLGIPTSQIICEYGMSELSSQAYDIEVSGVRGQVSGGETAGNSPHVFRAFHFPPWARAQVLSPETGCEVADGETGLLRIFDLANVCSVMAIQTEDLAVRRGDGFELLGRASQSEPRGCSLMTQSA